MILYVVARPSRFTDIDRDVLAERWEVREWVGRHPVRDALATARAVAGADGIVVWFAGWHALVPVTVAWLLRRPSLLITGGYDVAAVPEAGYGMQRGGLARFAARWALRRATRLMANSESGRREALAAAPKATVDVVHHGVPDLVAQLPDGPRSGALTVGIVDVRNLHRKGLLPFVQAAALVPEERFAVVGKVEEEAAVQELRAAAADNVELVGWVDDAELSRRYATAAVYVQPSRHEGFGMSVAEAMLAGCIPVVTRAGALPEVVGETGVVIDSPSPEQVAEGVRRALAKGEEARAGARRRVLELFTLQQRGDGLQASVRAAGM